MLTMSTMTAGCLALPLLNASPAAAQAAFGELRDRRGFAAAFRF